MLRYYLIKLLPSSYFFVLGIAFSTAKSSAEGNDKVAFSPKEFRKFKITDVKDLSANTKAFKIALPTPDHEMGLKVASFILVKGPISSDGKQTMRPYTPTSTNDQKGSFELVIKSYTTGVVSSYVHSLQPGDEIEVKGPIQKFLYTPNMKKSLGMIAGGSGITPMLQVIREVLKNAAGKEGKEEGKDKTKIALLFANTTEADILCKTEIDELAESYPEQFQVTYLITYPPGTNNANATASPSNANAGPGSVNVTEKDNTTTATVHETAVTSSPAGHVSASSKVAPSFAADRAAEAEGQMTTWSGGATGYITRDLVQEKIASLCKPGEGEESLILVCGPPGFMEVVCGNKTPDYQQGPVGGILKELGYTEETVFKF